MFPYRGIFLAVTISLASITLANVLVQPGYEHQYNSNPRYLQHQSVSQHWIPSPTEQYRAEQLPNQESTRYLLGVQTVYPYESNQADARSHVLSYPHRPPYHHYLPRPHHVHFARIGGHGYVRPSVYGYVGHPQSLMVHNRMKRSAAPEYIRIHRYFCVDSGNHPNHISPDGTQPKEKIGCTRIHPYTPLLLCGFGLPRILGTVCHLAH